MKFDLFTFHRIEFFTVYLLFHSSSKMKGEERRSLMRFTFMVMGLFTTTGVVVTFILYGDAYFRENSLMYAPVPKYGIEDPLFNVRDLGLITSSSASITNNRSSESPRVNFTGSTYLKMDNETDDRHKSTPSSTPRLPVAAMRDRVAAKLTISDILQIYKASVEPEAFEFEVNETRLAFDMKTEGIPEQNTCAVVGNSGILLESQCGIAIDSHDFVMRMNLAPFGSAFAKDVGTKGNITTLNYSQLFSLARCARNKFSSSSKLCRDLPLLKNYNHSIVWYPKGGARHVNMNILARGMKDLFKFDTRWAYSPKSLFGVIPRIWGIRTPSTGILVLSAASLFCREITMFGFYPFYVDSHNRTLKYHYYDDFAMNYTENAHKMPKEFQLFRKLESDGTLKIQREECKS